MAKDVNIHIKTQGADETQRKFQETAQSAQQMGDGVTQSSDRMKEGVTSSSDSMKNALRTLAGIAGFAGLATSAVAAVRKIINIVNDMRRAVAEAVQELSELQKTAADYFEAFDAYTPGQRKGALQLARSVQATTGLDYESSKSLLESYKRTYGTVDMGAVEQLAGYYQLHGGGATTGLVRWLGASGVTGPERQGQILRLISEMASQTGMKDPEIIQALTQYSTEFRQMGWTPEQTIFNVGRTISGLTGREARRAISGLVEGLRTFDEAKALEMGAPKDVAEDEQARMDWAAEQLRQASQLERRKLAQEMFGQTYAAYVTKYMLGELSPEVKRDLLYALTPDAAAEERKKVLAYRETAEGEIERAKGGAGRLKLEVSEQEQKEAAIREYGKAYLEYLRRTDRVRYEKIKAMYPGEELEYEGAAEELWWQGLGPGERYYYPPIQGFGPRPRKRVGWDKVPLDERLESLEQGAERISITNHIGDVYNTVEQPVGGPRTPDAFD